MVYSGFLITRDFFSCDISTRDDLPRKCKNDFAAKNTFDFESIDRDYEAAAGRKIPVSGWDEPHFGSKIHNDLC